MPLIPGAHESVRRLGFWSAVATTVFSMAYIVAQLAEWFGLLGSAGGAESSSAVFGLVVLLTPSLFLGSAFLLLLAAIHQAAMPERKIWSLSALAFGTVYTALISITYFVQLAWVAPRLAEGRAAGLEPFLFVPFDSFLYAVDILGYGFMSVATLLAARVFAGPGLERTLRWFLTANGMLLPFITLQMYAHWMIWIAALWAVTFPGATWTLALWFGRPPTGPGMEAPARP